MRNWSCTTFVTKPLPGHALHLLSQKLIFTSLIPGNYLVGFKLTDFLLIHNHASLLLARPCDIDCLTCLMQRRQSLEKMSGTSLPLGTASTQMEWGRTEQPCRGIGRPRAQTRPSTADPNMLVWRKLLFFTRAGHQRVLRQIGLCMSIA